MRTLRTLFAACCALAPAAALAAEAPPADWSGFYVGLHLGGANGNSEWTDLVAGPIGGHSPTGFVGGGQAGYNFQRGAWVFGPEVSLSGSTVDGRHLDTQFQGPSPQYDKSAVDLFGAATGRLGYSWGPLLTYAKAGIGWAHTTYSLNGYYAPNLQFAVGDDTRIGPTVGAGLAYALSPSWSAFLEYDYLRLGSADEALQCTAILDCGPPGLGHVNIRIDESYNFVKAGLNLRF
jgi:outer membrane immunogenic protein